MSESGMRDMAERRLQRRERGCTVLAVAGEEGFCREVGEGDEIGPRLAGLDTDGTALSRFVWRCKSKIFFFARASCSRGGEQKGDLRASSAARPLT